MKSCALPGDYAIYQNIPTEGSLLQFLNNFLFLSLHLRNVFQVFPTFIIWASLWISVNQSLVISKMKRSNTNMKSSVRIKKRGFKSRSKLVLPPAVHKHCPLQAIQMTFLTQWSSTLKPPRCTLITRSTFQQPCFFKVPGDPLSPLPSLSNRSPYGSSRQGTLTC